MPAELIVVVVTAFGAVIVYVAEPYVLPFVFVAFTESTLSLDPTEGTTG